MKDNDKNKFEHYFTEKPTSSLKIKNTVFELDNGHMYTFKTPSGVYSYGGIDKATSILINHSIPKSGDVLDIGCGYGALGIVIKKEYPECNVYMSDVNERAVEFAKINAKDNNVEVTIKQGNLYEPWEGLAFDHIISNPPLASGKEVWIELVRGAYNLLKPGGTLELVAYHNKGGERIRNFMKEIFGNAEDIWKEGGIRIYLSRKE